MSKVGLGDRSMLRFGNKLEITNKGIEAYRMSMTTHLQDQSRNTMNVRFQTLETSN